MKKDDLTAATAEYMVHGKRPEAPTFNELVGRHEGEHLTWEEQQAVINSLPNVGLETVVYDRIDQRFSTPEISPNMRKVFTPFSLHSQVSGLTAS